MAKNISIKDRKVRIQIWDTAGQEAYRSITRSYYKSAACVFIVYDISDKKSFNHIKDWMDDVVKYTDSKPIQIIVGNKCDLKNERQVDENDIKIMSQQTGLNVIETSAKNSIKINEAIEMLTRKLIQNKIRNNMEENFNTNRGVNLNDLKEGSNDNNGCNLCN